MIYFFVGLAVIGVLFGLIHSWVSGQVRCASILYFMAFFFDAEGIVETRPTISYVLAASAGAIRTAAHAAVLGAVVVKLLVPQELFKFRDRLFIRRNNSGEWEAIVRLYNATKTEVLDVEFDAHLRTPVSEDARSVGAVSSEGLKIVPFVSNRTIEVSAAKRRWPISLWPIPYSLPIPLHLDDVCYASSGQRKLRKFQGRAITPTCEGSVRGESFLIVTARGRLPALANDLVQTSWFQLSGTGCQYEFGDFHDVFVHPGSEPRKPGGAPRSWRGWSEFEKARPVISPSGPQWVFGYGSLVDAQSLAAFFRNEGLEQGRSGVASLSGFRRVWNVAMDNSVDLPNYKHYFDENRQRLDGYVTFLNIERIPTDEDQSSGTAGVVFEVTDKSLAALDRRERNYCRIDVSDRFANVAGTVWTYIGSPEAEERFRLGMLKGKAVIDANYKIGVERAFVASGIPYEARLDAGIAIVPLVRVDA